eukprot:CAMPEP_0118689746 /NCGR_PEP_ID=MMETSP0800-20121206/9667_1 /TAXON_ID=210618 ORGANISM="Striatella unipunctata, Strain CCMP2910" /NCGR_SAMPLE_ID=MMETSP0800 /ASSEMBLY_ACC=CAM_ASM_000638 /LENGTH=805 /DNA_ID=CAMNT_0006587191 /DNA_START=9 /DNA_END=2426 /DNA_ORIENTATION=+
MKLNKLPILDGSYEVSGEVMSTCSLHLSSRPENQEENSHTIRIRLRMGRLKLLVSRAEQGSRIDESEDKIDAQEINSGSNEETLQDTKMNEEPIEFSEMKDDEFFDAVEWDDFEELSKNTFGEDDEVENEDNGTDDQEIKPEEQRSSQEFGGYWATDLPELEIEIGQVGLSIDSTVEPKHQFEILLYFLQHGTTLLQEPLDDNDSQPIRDWYPLLLLANLQIILQTDNATTHINVHNLCSQGQCWHFESLLYRGNALGTPLSFTAQKINGSGRDFGLVMKVEKMEHVELRQKVEVHTLNQLMMLVDKNSIRMSCSEANIRLFSPIKDLSSFLWAMPSSYSLQMISKRLAITFEEGSNLNLISADLRFSPLFSGSEKKGDKILDGMVVALHEAAQVVFNDWLFFDNPRISSSINKDFDALSGMIASVEKARLSVTDESTGWIKRSLSPSETNATFAAAAEFAKIDSFEIAISKVNDPIMVFPEKVFFVGTEGDPGVTLEWILNNFCTCIDLGIRALDKRREGTKSSMRDGLVISAGMAVANASIATPVGLAASVVALGASDGVAAAAKKGKEERGVSDKDSYRFGDVTRGTISGLKSLSSSTLDKGKESRGASSSDGYRFGDFTRGALSGFKSQSSSNVSSDSNDNPKQPSSEGYIDQNKERFSRVGGSSVGAAIGMGFVGGPVGLVAGSVLGGAMVGSIVTGKKDTIKEERSKEENDFEETKHVGQLQENEQTHFAPDQARSSDGGHGIAEQQTSQNADSQEKRGYRFGDITRGVVARGKRADNRDDQSGYKFGDFTRGLIGGRR